MQKTAKILYAINSMTCIFIGLLHTNAHFADLLTAEIKERTDYDVIVSGLPSNIWDLWQGMSLMMGFLLIIVGLLHFLIISRLNKTEYPPIMASLIMMLMLCGVIYIGGNYFSAWQVYGGIGGLILQSICLILSFRKV